MPVEAGELRSAAAKALKLIQRSQGLWYKKETCTSCHHQLLPEIALKLARERGVPFDETVARDSTAAAFAYLKDLDAAVQGYDYVDVFFDGWALVAAHAAGIAPSSSTAAYAQFIASRQLADGSWPTVDGRPPQAYSRFTATAVCAQAIRFYLPESMRGEKEARLRRAREWLLKAQPRTSEDRTFQLLGLQWTGADAQARRRVAQQLLAQQREDGGWSQLPRMASDAYATGEALYALREGAGLTANDAACQRALRFLVNAQKADGSWHVGSRLHPPAPVSPPYFDAEFPYQHDQFISIMGSSWAAAALALAIPPKAGGGSSRPPLASADPAERAEWIDVALSGSAADLKRLLDRGMKPDAKTAGGTTALMLAARDPAKVSLLIERGADVNARAQSGVTPLMVAARYSGNLDVVRLMLKKGARPNADQAAEVRNNAAPLFFAVMAGDVQMVEALRRAGARLGDRMKILGRFFASPLLYATSGGDLPTVTYLLSQGADPNEVDDDRISVLAWATIANHVEIVQALLARGADVNHVDNHGMAPLLYAASIDFGDLAVMEKLIAAGADVKAKDRQGRTALDLARTYNHSMMAGRLSDKASGR